MKMKQIIDVRDWETRDFIIGVGHGTRDKSILKKTKKGKVYYMVKTYGKEVGELRSEVCASHIGQLFSFPVQKSWLCKIPQYKALGLSHSIGVVIRMDVRRQRDTRYQHFREDMVHGEAIVTMVKPSFSSLPSLTASRNAYTLEVVMAGLREYVSRNPGSEIVWDQFFEMLVFDALIGGTDRHYNNWGILEVADSGEFVRLAPAFDNGVSLLWHEAHLRKFVREALTGRFVSKGRSMFRKAGGGRYSFPESIQTLFHRGDMKDDSMPKSILERLDAVPDRRILQVLRNRVPRSKVFRTSGSELETVSEYVIHMKRVVQNTLQGLL